jgi:hypothetical protein
MNNITLDNVDLTKCKFSKLKEHLVLAKQLGDKELEDYVRKTMTKKYIEHQRLKLTKELELSDNTNAKAKTQQMEIVKLPEVIPYNKKKDKYSNIIVNQINMRQRQDSDFAIAESIRNNNKMGFMKPYA